jgi:protein TonB
VARAATIDVRSCRKPEYPTVAIRANAEGLTKIRFSVDAQGRVDESKTVVEQSAGRSREHRALDSAAVEALSKCRFTPGTDETGRPVGAFSVVEYNWKLE